MDRKMFDVTDYYSRAVREDVNSDSMVENCFNADFCNPPPQQDVSDVLTMAFVNMQPIDYVFNEDEAFSNGSLFPNITKPFFGGNLK